MRIENRRCKRLPPGGAWSLGDARTRLGEIVRRAQTEGPQRITIRGKDAAVIIAATEYDRNVPFKLDETPVPDREGLTGTDFVKVMQEGCRLGLKLKPFRAYLHARPPK